MNIHEHQAKELLRQYNIPTPSGYVAFTTEEAIKVSKKLPGIEKTVDNFAKRLDFLENNGVNLDLLDFEGSYGRTSMEYYDGFVFGFYSETYKDLAPVATGGRYDALTERMGQGKRIPAVGAVLRPDLTLLLRGNKHD